MLADDLPLGSKSSAEELIMVSILVAFFVILGLTELTLSHSFVYNAHAKQRLNTFAQHNSISKSLFSYMFRFILIHHHAFEKNLLQHSSSSSFLYYTGRFIMLPVITNIYNKKTKGPTWMELFTAPGKLQKVFFWQLEIFDVCRVTRGGHIEHL
jgi:hypothetical protein